MNSSLSAMPMQREDAERMADILEAMLAQLSWPQDADHIVNIKSTLDTIKSSLFTSLLDVQTQAVDVVSGATQIVQNDTVEIPTGDSDFQQSLGQFKETNVDDNDHDDDHVVNCSGLYPLSLTSPLGKDVVLHNCVAMEMQEPLSSSHNTYGDQKETAFVTTDNCMECNNVITNIQCQPSQPLSPGYNQCKSNLKSSSPSIPNEPGYKAAACQRDALFPMRDHKSLSEIKQTLQRRADCQDQEA